MPVSTNTHPIVCFGEILWDIFPGGNFPGGAPLNVAYHLRKLGGHPILISRLGLDDMGEKLINLIDGYGIGTEYFQLDNELPTGKVIAHMQKDHEVLYDILRPSAWDSIQWEDNFQSLVSEAPYFVFGSLVTRNPVSRDTLYRMLEPASHRVLDANLRAPYYNREIIEKLFTGLHLLKLNAAELELVTGWFSPYKRVSDRMQLLQDRFHIPSIVVTNGSKGAIFNADGVFYEHPGFECRVVDTVGSGDAFLAALLTRLHEDAPAPDALAFANAAGALVAGRRGACPLYSPEDIRQVIAAAISS